MGTGSTFGDCTYRRTDQALLGLIHEAKTSTILVVFAGNKMPVISAALVRYLVRQFTKGESYL